MQGAWASVDQLMLQLHENAFCLQDGESSDLAYQICHPSVRQKNNHC